MSLETDLQVALELCCPHVFPVLADPLPPGNFVTWQLIGGPSWRYVDNTPASARSSLVQIQAWSTTLGGALALARQIEEVLCAAQAFNARPEGEPVDRSEPELMRWGLSQDFTIVGSR